MTKGDIRREFPRPPPSMTRRGSSRNSQLGQQRANPRRSRKLMVNDRRDYPAPPKEISAVTYPAPFVSGLRDDKSRRKNQKNETKDKARLARISPLFAQSRPDARVTAAGAGRRQE